MTSSHSTHSIFAPHLAIKVLLPAIEFYERAFDAKEIRRWTNSDGSVHVAEMEIDGALFHLHEESPEKNQFSPETKKMTTVLVGLFVSDPAAVAQRAVEAGGEVSSPVQDYDYGYRQGVVTDPFGHQWLIQKKL